MQKVHNIYSMPYFVKVPMDVIIVDTDKQLLLLVLAIALIEVVLINIR